MSDTILIDVAYALAQLTRARRKQWLGCGCLDELQRLEDALERIQEAAEAMRQEQSQDSR